jgi:hypothetical protein
MGKRYFLSVIVIAAILAGVVLYLTSSSSPDRQTRTTPTRDAPSQPDTGEAKEKGSSEGKATPPPAYIPPAVHDPVLKAFVDRESKEHRVTGDIHVRLPKVTHPDDIKAVAGVLLDTKDNDTVRHEAANLLRRSNYAGLTQDLLTVLRKPEEKERFRSFVVQHLWSQARDRQDERPRIVDELHACLEDRHVAVRRDALLALVRLEDQAGVETALKWFGDAKPESEGVQDLCVRVIRERDLREHLPAIRKLIGSPNEDAARQAMVTVGQWGDRESRPLLEEAAKSTRPLVKRAADAALKKLDQDKAAPPQSPAVEEGTAREPARSPRF